MKKSIIKIFNNDCGLSLMTSLLGVLIMTGLALSGQKFVHEILNKKNTSQNKNDVKILEQAIYHAMEKDIEKPVCDVIEIGKFGPNNSFNFPGDIFLQSVGWNEFPLDAKLENVQLNYLSSGKYATISTADENNADLINHLAWLLFQVTYKGDKKYIYIPMDIITNETDGNEKVEDCNLGEFVTNVSASSGNEEAEVEGFADFSTTYSPEEYVISNPYGSLIKDRVAEVMREKKYNPRQEKFGIKNAQLNFDLGGKDKRWFMVKVYYEGCFELKYSNGSEYFNIDDPSKGGPEYEIVIELDKGKGKESAELIPKKENYGYCNHSDIDQNPKFENFSVTTYDLK